MTERTMLNITFGPVSKNESFGWVVTDVINYMQQQGMLEDVVVSYFIASQDIAVDTDIVFFVKALPSFAEIKRLHKSKLCFIPIDMFSSRNKVDQANYKLESFDKALVHSDVLGKYLPGNLPSYPIDHYTKYQFEWQPQANESSPIAWIGVYEYIPATLAYLHHSGGLSKPYQMLTNLASITPRRLKKIQQGCKRFGIPCDIEQTSSQLVINGYVFTQWSASAQKELMAACYCVLDIKDDSFRQQVKPPTKCQLYASAGVPVLVNDNHPAIGYLHKRGIELLTLEYANDFTSEQISAYGTQLKAQTQEQFSLASIASQYKDVIADIATTPIRPKKISLTRRLGYAMQVLRGGLSKTLK